MPENQELKPKTEWVEPELEIEKKELPKIQLPKFEFGSEKIKKLGFLAGLVLISGLGIFLVFSYLINLSQPETLGLSIYGQDSVNPGEKVLFELIVSNRSKKQTLTDITITIRADSGTILADAPNLALFQKPLPDLGPETDYKELIPVIFWGQAQETRQVEVMVRYQSEGVSTKLEKQIVWEPRISRAGAELNFSLPQEVLSGEDFAGYFTYKNITNKLIPDFDLVLETPKDFSVSFADPEKFREDLANESKKLAWESSNLEAQKEQRVSFRGNVSGGDYQGKIFKAQLTVPVRNSQIVLAEIQEDLVIVANPLALGIMIHDQSDYRASLKDNLRYQISFKNNYNVSLKDIVITADISDPWFNLNKIKTETGFFSSRDKKIIWNGGNTPQLLALASGESGQVQFYIDLKDYYLNQGTNNSVKLRVEISAANKPGQIGTEVLAKSELVTKINGQLVLTPKLVFQDNPETGFVNSGSSTPKVNQVTQYTLYLNLKSQANEFKNVLVKTVFPTNVSYDGKIKGDLDGTNFTFNPRTGELNWRLDYLPAYAEKQIAIQLGLVPSMDQVGRLVSIVNPIETIGQDLFTGNDFSVQTGNIYSDLPDDNIVDQNSGRVVP
ncbi:MAG: hypothetical protein AB1721_02065 [Patescibacteria group bacterium]